MKHQYFGDRHDFAKYAILRRLTWGNGVRTAVCWMLTEPDDSNDGRHTGYLSEPESWRDIDPPLFDCLRRAVMVNKRRRVGVIERSGLLGEGAYFRRATLTDDADQRRRYFRGFFQKARGRELAFFDPDMGLEVDSVKYGRRGSSKYLYLHEAAEAYERGHSLLVFQGRQRKQPGEFAEALARRLLAATGAPVAYVFLTSLSALAFLPHPDHAERFAVPIARIRGENWGGVLETLTYHKEGIIAA